MTRFSAAEQTLREAVIAAARVMNARTNNRGLSGNVSARLAEAGFSGFLVTPSGMHYDTLEVDDVVAMQLDGAVRPSETRVPSSEWPFHRAIYRARSDVDAVVHTHSIFATTLACLGRGIPAFHYMVAKAGGSEIRCAPYARFGSEELAQSAVAALEGTRACLLAQHGMITVGRDPQHALDLAVEVESLAEIYWRTLQLSEPNLLSAREMQGVIDKFSSYGQPPSRD